MSIAYITTTNQEVVSGSPASQFDVPKPSTLAVGDLMVADVLTNGATINLPTGWTDIVNLATVTNPKQRVMYKVADATDVAASTFTFTLGASSYGEATIHHYTGVDTTTPLDFAAQSVQSSTSITAFAMSAASAVTDGCVLIGGSGANTGTVSSTWTDPSTPGAWTVQYTPTAVSGLKSMTCAYYATPLAASDSSGAVTFTLSTARAGSAWFVGLRPAAGGGGAGNIAPSGLASAEAFGSAVVSQPAAPSVVSSWVGGVTGTTATVAVKTSGASSCRLKVSTTSDLLTSPVFSSSVTPDADGITKLSVSGLSADTSYFFGVELDGSTLVVDGGSFKTFPTGQASFSFAFASCQNATDSSVWADALVRDPLFFMHLGDFWYDDGAAQTEASYRSHYDAKLAATNQHEFFRKKPVAYAWSDHDFGMNNNAFGTGYANRGNAQAVYDQYVPYWERPDSGGAIYQTFVVGRVRFIMMDTMSYKTDWSGTDNSSKTILGATQKQWVKDTIAAAAEKLIVISSDVPWVGAAAAGDDAWDGYTTERTELTDFFLASGKNICIIAGDMHALAVDDGTNADGIRVFQSAPMNNTSSHKGGPWSEGSYPTTNGTSVQQYSIIDVTDSGTSITLAYTGYSSDVAHLTYSTTFQLVDPSGIGSGEAFGSAVVGNAASSQSITGAGGTASTEAFGSATVTTAGVTISPSGISTAEGFGTPSVATGPVEIAPGGIASTEQFGALTVNIGGLLITPTGITTDEAFGLPVLTTSSAGVVATGIPTAEAFGLPRVRFLQKIVFRTPAIEERAADRLGRALWWEIPHGITVLKIAGVYHEVRSPTDAELEQATAVYRGGYDNEVTVAEAADLAVAGYSVELIDA